MNRALRAITAFLYLSAFLTIVLTAHIDGYETLLKDMSRENGFFETLSVIILLAISLQGVYYSVKNRATLPKLIYILSLLLAAVAFVAAMEEISWGQQIFHFQSEGIFKEANLQHETNLHNFIAPELFSSIIYVSIYTYFVFMPLIIKMLSTKTSLFNLLLPYLPSLHVTLIILFSASFQAYFYDDFGAYVDMATQFIGLLMLLFYMLKGFEKVTASHWWHLATVTVTIVSFLLSYKAFGFFNMQYEIREMFVALGIFYYQKEVLQKVIRA